MTYIIFYNNNESDFYTFWTVQEAIELKMNAFNRILHKTGEVK